MMDRVAYWIDIADYDFDTAKAMLATKRYLYVGFMCHQVVEKLLKAYWSKMLEEPPLKIHHLARLAEKSGLTNELSEGQFAFIDELEPLNIETRYPAYKEQLARKLTPNYCEWLLNKTNEFRTWIKLKLSS
ncbi:MAG: HEPN domain-containing protein [Prevotellaceae bacterium]|nr:HEPN domain-containing protein [Prevotellaceae bacterium]